MNLFHLCSAPNQSCMLYITDTSLINEALTLDAPKQCFSRYHWIKKDSLLFMIITSHGSFFVSRRNVWINRGQSWTRGQKCALWTAWNDSSTPASLSWIDWNRLRGARARFLRPWQTKKVSLKGLKTHAHGTCRTLIVPVPHSLPDMAELPSDLGKGTALSLWMQVPAIDHTLFWRVVMLDYWLRL